MGLSSDSIRILQVISKTGSFSEAAKVLCRVPSAIGYSARKMEEEIGIKLFERRNGHIQLTSAANYILEQGDWILQGLQELERNAVRLNEGVESQFRIALNYIINHQPIPKLLANLLDKFPATEFSIRTEVYNGTWDSLYEDRADFVIGAPQNPPWSHGNISTEYLGDVEWVFLVSPNHPLATEEQVLKAAKLRQFPSIIVHDSSIALQHKKTWALKGQKVIYVADLNMVLSMIIEGVGIGFVPRGFAASALLKGTVVEKVIAEHKQPIRVYYAWKNQRNSQIINYLLDLLCTDEYRNQWLI
ncbi:LysR substrate-binding domain-containing protein [Gallibacterium trehalosifermentans]|uniref:LysR substrate-binding domain-containing protein n=1 Tax=Gallibacterium trehalosifermentans TaxID=516935 RepID=A0ABV6H2V9_9PAST